MMHPLLTPLCTRGAHAPEACFDMVPFSKEASSDPSGEHAERMQTKEAPDGVAYTF